MIKSISKSRTRSRRMLLRGFMRWFLYAAVLLFFYMWQTNPLIRGFCPLLMIPLATAVAMREGELAAGIFGAVCGLMLDMAGGTAILGFSSLWLLVFCPVISLLSYYCVKVNFISHFVLNLAVCVIMGLLDFLFLHSVWEGAEAVISFANTVFPAYLGAALGAVPVYFLAAFISARLRPKEKHHPDESASAQDEGAE